MLLFSSVSEPELLPSDSLELLSELGDMAASGGGGFVRTAEPEDLALEETFGPFLTM